jgi:hypothetical protein
MSPARALIGIWPTVGQRKAAGRGDPLTSLGPPSSACQGACQDQIPLAGPAVGVSQVAAIPPLKDRSVPGLPSRAVKGETSALGSHQARIRQLGLLGTAQASDRVPVDAVLASPHMDRLLADPSSRDTSATLRQASTRSRTLPAELRPGNPICHSGLRVPGHQNPVFRFHRSRDT